MGEGFILGILMAIRPLGLRMHDIVDSYGSTV